jgi:hypothetical protein
MPAIGRHERTVRIGLCEPELLSMGSQRSILAALTRASRAQPAAQLFRVFFVPVRVRPCSSV